MCCGFQYSLYDRYTRAREYKHYAGVHYIFCFQSEKQNTKTMKDQRKDIHGLNNNYTALNVSILKYMYANTH